MKYHSFVQIEKVPQKDGEKADFSVLVKTEGKMTGIGRIVFYKDSDIFTGVYEGEIFDGRAHGFGRLIRGSALQSGAFNQGINMLERGRL